MVVDTRLSNAGGGAGLHPAGDRVDRRLDLLLLLGGWCLLVRLPASLLQHLGTCRPRLSLLVLQLHQVPLGLHMKAGPAQGYVGPAAA